MNRRPRSRPRRRRPKKRRSSQRKHLPKKRPPPKSRPRKKPPRRKSGPTLTIWGDEIRAPVLDEISQAFTDEFGVKVDVVQKGFNDLRNDYKVAAPTGEGPDIVLGAHDWLGEMIASGLLAEVSLGDKADLFAPNAVDAFTYTDGKLYGMPSLRKTWSSTTTPTWCRNRRPPSTK